MHISNNFAYDIILDGIDTVEKRIRLLFAQCARGELHGVQADVEYSEVLKEYYKILEDADEKVQLANLMYDLVDRYLRRLDSELFKFKLELEADHNGITEILEKRSLELDGGTTNPILNSTGGVSQKENRFFGMITTNNHSQNRDRYHRSRPEKRRNSSTSSPQAPPEKRPAISNSVSIPITPITTVPPPVPPPITLPPPPPPPLQPSTIPYNLPHLNSTNSVPSPVPPTLPSIKHLHPGRRTSNMNSSFDSIHAAASSTTHDLLLGREVSTPTISGSSSPLTPGIDRDTSFLNNQRRHKK